MSQDLALAAISRMNMRELAIAVHYTALSNDLAMLARADMAMSEAEFMQRRRLEMVQSYGLEAIDQRKPFAFSSGVAIVPVHGTLINRFSSSWGYVTGYNFIRNQVYMAGQDPDVAGILLDTNSYGGEAAGCFECSADLKRLANGKPLWSCVDSNCYSAAYAMASGTDRILVTPSGGAGSIGVVAAHVSLEGALQKFGIKVTFIHAGAHKVDGNPYEDLPDSVKADIQKLVNKSMDAFVALVAKGRKMDEKAVRATEARVYRSEEAMSLGLIDAVATPQEAMRAFMGELSGSNQQPRKENAMSDATKPGDTNNAPDVNKAAADARASERARVSGILSCEEAKGREALANHFALKTDMSVEDAKAALAASPKAEAAPAATGNAFANAMANTPNPNVKPDASGDNGKAETASGGILAAARLAGVMGFESNTRQ